jgi:predicted DNA-binding transcriptional regulator AlpA
MAIKKSNNYILPETGFLRINQVLQFIPVGRSTWWAGVKSGRFPQSIKLGTKTTVWRAEDIRALVEQLGGSSSSTLS